MPPRLLVSRLAGRQQGRACVHAAHLPVHACRWLGPELHCGSGRSAELRGRQGLECGHGGWEQSGVRARDVSMTQALVNKLKWQDIAWFGAGKHTRRESDDTRSDYDIDSIAM